MRDKWIAGTHKNDMYPLYRTKPSEGGTYQCISLRQGHFLTGGFIWLLLITGSQLSAGGVNRCAKFTAHCNGNIILFQNIVKAQDAFPTALGEAQILCFIVRNQIYMETIIPQGWFFLDVVTPDWCFSSVLIFTLLNGTHNHCADHIPRERRSLLRKTKTFYILCNCAREFTRHFPLGCLS